MTDAANSTPDSIDCVFNSARDDAVGYVCGTASDVIPHVLSTGYYSATDVWQGPLDLVSENMIQASRDGIQSVSDCGGKRCYRVTEVFKTVYW